MVKCLIRIETKVNVHLRMVNHCYRDVKVRVLSLGPRLLGKALGALPLFPSLTEGPAPEQTSEAALRLAVPPNGCPGNFKTAFSEPLGDYLVVPKCFW